VGSNLLQLQIAGREIPTDIPQVHDRRFPIHGRIGRDDIEGRVTDTSRMFAVMYLGPNMPTPNPRRQRIARPANILKRFKRRSAFRLQIAVLFPGDCAMQTMPTSVRRNLIKQTVAISPTHDLVFLNLRH